MAIIDQTSINYEYVKIRWQEPYVSYAVARRTFGIIPKGIYSGMKLDVSPMGDRFVRIKPGFIQGNVGTGVTGPGYANGNYDESAQFSIAVHQNTAGVQSVVTIPPGIDENYDLDLAGEEGNTVYIVMDVNYSTGVQTTAEFKAVEAADIDADPTLIVIGRVNVPSGITPISLGDISYNDVNYPRISPIANDVRTGWSASPTQIFPWLKLCQGEKDPTNGLRIQIKPSQIVTNNKRYYSYVNPTVSSRFPRDASGDYNGGVNNDQLTFLNFNTGVISGAHAIPSNLSFTPAPIITVNNKFQVAIVTINAADEIGVVYGGQFNTSADAVKDSNLPAAGSGVLQVCSVLLSTNGSGALNTIADTSVFDRRPVMGVGGGGGLSEIISLEWMPDDDTTPASILSQSGIKCFAFAPEEGAIISSLLMSENYSGEALTLQTRVDSSGVQFSTQDVEFTVEVELYKQDGDLAVPDDTDSIVVDTPVDTVYSFNLSVLIGNTIGATSIEAGDLVVVRLLRSATAGTIFNAPVFITKSNTKIKLGS